MSDNSGVSEAEVQEGGSKWIPVSYRNSRIQGYLLVKIAHSLGFSSRIPKIYVDPRGIAGCLTNAYHMCYLRILAAIVGFSFIPRARSD